MPPKKVIVGITGASGSIYPKLLLEKLITIKDQWEEVGVVLSDNARIVWEKEITEPFKEFPGFRYFDKKDFFAPFASGSAKFNTMIVCPCSMGTLGRIANGISDDLITRAADVILKEKRKLILNIRETPYNLIHLKNMESLVLAGGIICPASPSFYGNPANIEELALTVVDRLLDLADFKISSKRWNSPSEI